jgi:hypothetical protein
MFQYDVIRNQNTVFIENKILVDCLSSTSTKFVISSSMNNEVATKSEIKYKSFLQK